MATPDGIILTAGALAFAGNFAEQDGFPSNGYAIIGGTVALTFLASLTNNTPITPAVKGFAWLVLLGSAYRYIPAFTTKKTGKGNG